MPVQPYTYMQCILRRNTTKLTNIVKFTAVQPVAASVQASEEIRYIKEVYRFGRTFGHEIGRDCKGGSKGNECGFKAPSWVDDAVQQYNQTLRMYTVISVSHAASMFQLAIADKPKW